jgi:sugar lactone lactonase YvrE
MSRDHAELASDTQHELAEGPRWDDSTGTASWVDIAEGYVFTGVLDGELLQVTSRLDFRNTVGAAVPASDGGYLVAAHDRLVAVAPDGSRRSSEQVVDRGADLRLNDAAVDPAGRLLVGSLATDHRLGAAALFRLEAAGTCTVVRDGLNLANGIGWSPDGSRLYLADSVPGVVWSASYDIDNGEAHSWTPLVTELNGLPDGLCVDTEGRLWVALWNGAQVACFAPTGELVHTVTLPVPHVTAVAFVGPARDRLLITSARDELDSTARATYPLSGRLFLADVGAVGLPTHRWVVTDGSSWHPNRAQFPL